MRRLRQIEREGETTLPQAAALARLDRSGPSTATALAMAEQISPQGMGATLAVLESRGLIERSAHPHDGRKVVLSINDAGRKVLRYKRNQRSEQMAMALSNGFTTAELELLLDAAPLIERLSQNM